MSFASPTCNLVPIGREVKSIPSVVIFSAKHPGPAEMPVFWQSLCPSSTAAKIILCYYK
jgi:hypothetical protein